MIRVKKTKTRLQTGRISPRLHEKKAKTLDRARALNRERTAALAQPLKDVVRKSDDARLRNIAQAYLDEIDAGHLRFPAPLTRGRLPGMRMNVRAAKIAAQRDDWKRVIQFAVLALGPLPGKAPHDSPSRPDPGRGRPKRSEKRVDSTDTREVPASRRRSRK